MPSPAWRDRLRPSRTPPTEPLISRIHPYLVSAGYPDSLSTPAQQQRRIGHDLSVALVVPASPGRSGDNMVAAVSATQLAADGIDLESGYAHAHQNLATALSGGQIAVELFDQGPAGVPTAVFSGSWLAATALVTPGLRDKMSRLLGGDVVAAVPHRELLFVFTSAGIAGMTAVIDAQHRHASYPLTTGLFALGAQGPRRCRKPLGNIALDDAPEIRFPHRLCVDFSSPARASMGAVRAVSGGSQAGQACRSAFISPSSSRLIFPTVFADGGCRGFNGSCWRISSFARLAVLVKSCVISAARCARAERSGVLTRSTRRRRPSSHAR